MPLTARPFVSIKYWRVFVETPDTKCVQIYRKAATFNSDEETLNLEMQSTEEKKKTKENFSRCFE